MVSILLSQVLLQSTFLLIVGCVVTVIALFLIKNTSGDNSHLLEIDAYSDYMMLTQYDNTTSRAMHLKVKYADIKMCFLAKDYKSVCIMYDCNSFTEDKRESYEGKSVGVLQKGKMYLTLNTSSPEQGFFFYTAPKLFKMQNKQWKIIKKYGTEQEYYEKIYTEE